MGKKTYKALFVMQGLGYGGAEKMFTYIANQLSLRGHDIYIYTYGESSQHYKISSQIKHIQAEATNKFKSSNRIIETGRILLKMRQEIKSINPDIVISFLNFPNLLNVIATLFMKNPAVICERGDPYQVRSKKARIRQQIYNLADGAVFQTEQARAYYSKKLQEKSCVIANPVTLTQVSSENEERQNEIAFVGRFEVVQKRQDIMVMAFAKVVKQYPDVKLNFYGDGEDKTKIEQLVKELNLQANVVFHGVTKDVVSQLRKSKIFVLTSDYEGIPNALIEAMASGVPVISTDCSPGGARLLIENNKNGILVPVGDVEKLADKMLFLLNNPDIAECYGKEAMKIKERFKPEHIILQWEQYIEEVIGKHV